MKLSALLESLEAYRRMGSPDREVTGLRYDSRQVEPGDLFVAFPYVTGYKVDGHDYAKMAAARGASVLLLERDVRDGGGMPTRVLVPSTRRAAARMAARFYGHPEERLSMVGITGTNGKTTVCHLVRALFEEEGIPTGLVGTLGYQIGPEHRTTLQTTPEAIDLYRILSEMVQGGRQVVAMEVSSHALVLDRICGIRFEVGVFTNLGRDHLDFHGDVAHYVDAKARLFEGLDGDGTAVINIDDPVADRLVRRTRARVLTYGFSEAADVRTTRMEVRSEGISMSISLLDRTIEIRSKLSGRFNTYNILAAVGVGVACGLEDEVLQRGVLALERMPGRFERVETGQEFVVLVDYAHTPDALEHLLRAARELTAQRLIVVFGCGGDRDRGKRPMMGAVVARLADVAVVTSDNPRNEDPEAIIREILVGMPRGSDPVVLSDRREAIEAALGMARPGDVVVIAGKGHEDYQIMGNRRIHFDDREVVREVLGGKDF